MIRFVKNLYMQDARYGDAFIAPMRSYITQAGKIFTDLRRQPNSSLFVQSKQIAAIALSMIKALVMSFPAACGMIIKAFQCQPVVSPPAARNQTTPLSNVSKLLQIDPPSTNGVRPLNFHCPERQRASEEKNISSLHLIKDINLHHQGLPVDMLGYIGEFLHPEERMKAMLVSKGFRDFMRLPMLWSHFLGVTDLRIHGATRFVIKHEKDRNTYLPEDKEYLEHPYEQISTYFRMFPPRQARDIDCFEYWSRTMKGGPLGFANIPKVCLNKQVEELTVDDLNQSLSEISEALEVGSYWGFNLLDKTADLAMQQKHSIIMGIDVNQAPFLAFWVKRANEDQSLILFKRKDQIANGSWKANQLHLNELNDQNYLLALLNKELPNRNLDQYRVEGVSLVVSD